jgi:hypothetical protein
MPGVSRPISVRSAPDVRSSRYYRTWIIILRLIDSPVGDWHLSSCFAHGSANHLQGRMPLRASTTGSLDCRACSNTVKVVFRELGKPFVGSRQRKIEPNSFRKVQDSRSATIRAVGLWKDIWSILPFRRCCNPQRGGQRSPRRSSGTYFAYQQLNAVGVWR